MNENFGPTHVVYSLTLSSGVKILYLSFLDIKDSTMLDIKQISMTSLLDVIQNQLIWPNKETKTKIPN